MQRAHALAHPADYVLRAQHNRCLPQGGKLWPARRWPRPLGEIEFTLGSTHPATRTNRTPDPSCLAVALPDGLGGVLPR